MSVYTPSFNPCAPSHSASAGMPLGKRAASGTSAPVVGCRRAVRYPASTLRWSKPAAAIPDDTMAAATSLTTLSFTSDAK